MVAMSAALRAITAAPYPWVPAFAGMTGGGE